MHFLGTARQGLRCCGYLGDISVDSVSAGSSEGKSAQSFRGSERGNTHAKIPFNRAFHPRLRQTAANCTGMFISS